MSPTPIRNVGIVGCGYVGTALGVALVSRGYHVIGTTTSAAKVAELRRVGIDAVVADIADTRRLASLLSHCDAVALTLAAGRDGDYRRTYLDGACSLLAAIKGSSVRRVVYTSSTRVYGQTDGSWVDEGSPTIPTDERGKILLGAEQALLGGGRSDSRSPGFSCCVLRLGGIYGPGRELERRVRAVAGEELSGGDRYVNLIHIDDIVSALQLAITSEFSGLLNLCDDEPEPRRVLYDRLIQRYGWSPIRWISEGGDEVDRGKRVSNARVKARLGLELAYPMHVSEAERD